MALSSAAGDTTIPDSLQSLELELVSLMSGCRRAQEKLAQATLAADERITELRAKIEDLEGQNLARALKIRAQERELAELRAALASAQQPDMDVDVDRVIEERDDALQRLERAQKVIQGLLQPGGGPLCSCLASGPTPATAPPPKNRARSRRADSDDESTVRPERSVAGAAVMPTLPPPVNVGGTSAGSSSATRAPVEPAPSQESISSVSTTQTVSDAPSSASRAGKTKKGKVTKGWYLEFSGVPVTSGREFRPHGPIPFDVLAEQLVLEEKLQFEIRSLESVTGYDIRIVSRSDAAFIYRPVILECVAPKATYLIGWSDAGAVDSAEAWAQTMGDMNLFMWPIKKGGWFYIGLHSLTFARFESVWPKLPIEDKHRLLRELSGRNPGMDTAKFRKDVKEGRLVQYCLQLECKGRAESFDFLREYGLLAGSVEDESELGVGSDSG